ncbi:MAG: c-type cytochrome [Gammaproteobacteria bacterium]
MDANAFRNLITVACFTTFLFCGVAVAQPAVNAEKAASDYQTYCALCHGDDRLGYANDSAPSLLSDTLYELGPMVPSMAISYGRVGTPMGPYLDEVGGPLTSADIRNLAVWLTRESGHTPPEQSQHPLTPITGDIALGRTLYDENCTGCHGDEGQGHGPDGPGTALNNATMLATSPDIFLKAAIARGRSGTLMQSFGDKLSDHEINSLVAFLRTRAQGWSAEDMLVSEIPDLDDVVLNPEGEAPEFELKDDWYVSANDLNDALNAKNKMVLLDTRVPYFWGMAHIEGSLPLPYYSSREEIMEALPNDGTWIVAYCECPRAAADSLVTRLRELGFTNTAVLWEGYAGWAALGYPIGVGDASALLEAGGGHEH